MNEVRLARIEETVGEMRESLVKNTTILEINTTLLDEHMKRTDLLEKQVNGIAVEARIFRWIAAIGAVAATIIQIIGMKG